MKSYSYNLPQSRIAQRPVYPYDSAKLLVLNEGEILESTFADIAKFLSEKDLLVFNNTAVMPARLFAKLETGGQAEVLLVREVSENIWECLAKPRKKLKIGKRIIFTNELSGEVVENKEELLIQFLGTYQDIITAGSMPIPPYIRGGVSDEKDKKDYQTFFAEKTGSIAAPTASLHFTPELFKKLEDEGVKKTYLTLHVGTHSFLPLFNNEEGQLREPGKENYEISEDVWKIILDHKKTGGRVIAVGTTVVRALESGYGNTETKLFIQPGYKFKVIDGMITNFHQPETSHLLLVEAFTGREKLKESYEYALNNNFRFLSYGDGMLILS